MHNFIIFTIILSTYFYITIILHIICPKTNCSQKDVRIVFNGRSAAILQVVHKLLFNLTLGPAPSLYPSRGLLKRLKTPNETRVHFRIQKRAPLHAHLSSPALTACLCTLTATVSQTTNCYHVFTHSKSCFNSRHIEMCTFIEN